MLVISYAATTAAATFTVPDYAVGETARVEIITPFRLVVIDPEGSEKLRQAEATRVPAIFRFNQNVGQEAEAALKTALGNHRRKFLDSLEAVFNQRQISLEQMEQPRFQQVIRVYQRQNRNFPVLTNVARLWAAGETDLELQLDWSARLRSMHSNYIRAENLPAAARIGPARVFSVNPPDLPVDVITALQRSTNAARSNLLALSRAKRDIQGAFPPEAQNVGKFLAGFVRETCRFDEQLTAEHRAERTQTIFAAHAYEAGERLVSSGAVVTPKIKAALSEFRVRNAAQALQAELETERTRADAALAQLSSSAVATLAGPSRNETIYKWSLVSLLTALALWLLSRLFRSTAPPATALVPSGASTAAVQSSVDPPTIACPSCSEPIALAVAGADALAPPAGQVRSALVPHFAKLLASKMFRKLMWQRVYLAEAQRQAEAELRELENRLIQMQVPLKERMQAYENRVAELERQLTTAQEESRQLIRTQIAMLQKKLDEERARQADSDC